MSKAFKFRCPTCRRKFKANKDIAGRLKTCGQCSTTFVVRQAAPTKVRKKKKGRAAPPPPPPPPIPAQYAHHPVAEAEPVGSAVATLFTVLLILIAVAAGGYFVNEIYLKPRTGSTAKAPTLFVPREAAREPEKKWVEIAKDGIVLMDDGDILRGTLEKASRAIRVRAAGAERSVEPGQVGYFHIEAPAFIEGEIRKLDSIEGLVSTAESDGRTPQREALVSLLRELYRQGDRWAILEPLCRNDELPSGGTPIARIEKLKATVEVLLREADPPPVAAAPATPAGAAPETPKAAPANPSTAAAAELFARFSTDLDEATRLRLAGEFRALPKQNLPQADLAHFAFLILARSEEDWGMRSDRLEIISKQINQHYEGALHTQGDYFAQLTLPAGNKVTAYKEKKGWIAHIPGGMRLEDVSCRTTKGAETPSRKRITERLRAFPPVRWSTASGSEHLNAARAAAKELSGKDRPDARGRALLRYLAASHAAATLRLGTAEEIGAARTLLRELGYAENERGIWERAEDRRAVRIGQALREDDLDKAYGLLPDARRPQEFAGRYRALAVRLSLPLRDKEDLEATEQAIDRAVRQALTVSESRHLLALKKVVEDFGVCGHCGGSATRTCTTCKGRGDLTQACLDCNGLGYRMIVGIKGGAYTCGSCKGKPIRGTKPCERCKGEGSLSCRKCVGPFRLPTPSDLIRQMRTCSLCDGQGRHGETVSLSCPRCAGLGSRVVPAGEGKEALLQ